MIFAKLADVVIRHHKKILVAWLIILAFVVPAVLKVNDVLVYQESEMVAGNKESLIAQEIIDEQFPTAVANSTLMIVISGTDVTGPSVRDFCLDLENQTAAEDGLEYLESTTTIYSVFTGAITAATIEMGPMMYSAESEINLSANLLYGVPSLYVSNWIYYTNGSLNASDRDAEAYWITISALDIALSGEDETVEQATYLYFSYFAAAWNETSEDPVVSDPVARAEDAIMVAAPIFIGGMRT